MRIASLLPAATEIVGALGRSDDLVAVTFECDHPAGVRDRVPVVVRSALADGMTPAEIDACVRDRAAAGLPMYDLDREVLRAAAPDVVVTQDLCRVCALPGATVAEALDELGLDDVAVHSYDPHTLDGVLDGIAALGTALGTDPAPLLADLRARLDAVADAVADALAGRPRPRVLVLEWTDPPFLPGHWVPELVRRAGGDPVSGTDGGRSVPAAWEELTAGPRPDAVVVTPCGFGLADACAQAESVAARLPGVPLVAIDSASYVVRAAPRLVDGIEALAHALHPDAVPAPPAGRVARVA
ncbi:cobalamin-binding protein [Actinomycetospora sp. TBRC 11914]|uniref:cobalamin-binding protein n=1 Tax=Actinomycetospora sp. TBRC 11914 TaxID=2729387 RepID=UPI00145C981A|nr:cobalamin-binding protein [Actinomycetospora sp. TBRC 11914]NMO91973.1 cobalamin-binding protein [Actinomycetospora sp. TBRC 11914]